MTNDKIQMINKFFDTSINSVLTLSEIEGVNSKCQKMSNKLFHEVFDKLEDFFGIYYCFLGFGFFEVVVGDAGRQTIRITGSDVIFIEGMSYV